MSSAGPIHAEDRPPIVLTASDYDKLTALLRDASTAIDPRVARFLGEEIARADVAPNDVAPNSVVRMGCEVKFTNHVAGHILHARLVFPEEAWRNQCVSILSPTGTALIGLGPGQSIRWTEQGRSQRITVLEVRAGPDFTDKSDYCAGDPIS
jgi:regulator of nucleoside diphosphate kinase